MRPHDSKGSGRRSGRGPRRSSYSQARPSQQQQAAPPAKKSLWQKLIGFFRPSPAPTNGTRRPSDAPARQESRQSRKPEAVEVTSPNLYVGNLSYDATESDLFESFKGIGI